jgi:hypothetical protein
MLYCKAKSKNEEFRKKEVTLQDENEVSKFWIV